MIGSESLATRIGGVYALEQLAAEHAKEYHIRVMNLLCAFIRHPHEDSQSSEDIPQESHADEEEIPDCPPDVEEATKVIGRRQEHQLDIERQQGWRLDLNHCQSFWCRSIWSQFF